MALRIDELRQKIAKRSLDWARMPGTQDPLLAIQIDLAAPLPRASLEALLREGQQTLLGQVEGTIGPRFVEVSAEKVMLYLDPVHPGALRLDQLLASTPEPALDTSIAAALIITLAKVIHGIHLEPGLDGEKRVHLELHPRSILVAPGGSVALIGAGLPALEALLIGEPVREADRFRPLPPEAARGEPVDARADVYALGALYYELLAGAPYRSADSATLICTKAIEGHAPDLPGALPDPRPSLVALLQKALAAEADDRHRSALAFQEAVIAELGLARIPVAKPAALSQLVESVPEVGVVVGPMALIAPAVSALPGPKAATPKVAVAPPKAAAIADDLALAPAVLQLPPEPARAKAPEPATHDAWSAVLGDAPVKERPRAKERPVEAPKPISDKRLMLPSAKPAPIAIDAIDVVVEATLKPKSDPRSESRPDPKRKAKKERRPIAGYVVAVLVLSLAGGIFAYGKSRTQVVAQSDDELYEDDPTEEDAGAPGPLGDAPDSGRRRRRRAGAEPPPPSTTIGGEDSARPFGLFTVNSKPSGATVELDGGYVGTTPLVLRHQFEHRPYLVAVLAKGHRRWQKSVEPDPASLAINVMAVLEKE